MNRADLTEDIVFLLYLAPFAVAGIHGLLLWIGEGIKSAPSVAVFLTVTKDPFTFIVGVATVSVAVLIDLHSALPEQRHLSLRVNSRRLQSIAVAAVLLSLLFAWVATEYSANSLRVFSAFLNGRYSVIFPLFLFAVSLFLSLPPSITPTSRKTILEMGGFILLIISPLSIFGLSRLNYSLSTALAVSFATFTIGLLVLMYGVSRRPT